jgi:hypothetical protein
LVLSLCLAFGFPVAALADDPDRFFDQKRYHLTVDEGHYRL